MRSRAPRRGRNAPTSELDEAAAVEAMSLDDGGIDDPDAEVPLQATGGADVQAAGLEATIAQGICEDALRGEPEPRSGVLGTMTDPEPPQDPPQKDRNHPQSGRNHSSPEELPQAGLQLTAASMAERRDELFPAGAATPAAKPRQPPLADNLTNELAGLGFDG